MYMDENDVRSPRDRVDGDLLRRLLGEDGVGENVQKHSHDGTATPYRGNSGSSRSCDGTQRSGNSSRGCDGSVRVADRRGGMYARNESVSGGSGNGCGCGCDSDNTCGTESGEIGNTYPCGENGIEGRSLAMVYAPMHHWRNVYDPKTALSRGTLFRELDMPFYGDKNSARGGNCRGY